MLSYHLTQAVDVEWWKFIPDLDCGSICIVQLETAGIVDAYILLKNDLIPAI